MDPLETYEHAGRVVEIHYDNDPDNNNPRGFDGNLGTMVAEHSRYDLGDGTIASELGRDDFSGGRAFYRYLRIVAHAAVILPLGLFDHSGISMYVGADAHPHDPGGWDSGQVGVIYATREQVAAEYGADTPENRERAEQVLRAEVEAYDRYLRGEIYGYVVLDHEGNHLDSCWGIDDYDYARELANESADYHRAPTGAELARLSLGLGDTTDGRIDR